jgi:nucleoside 2-deoxyribosyltransferase/NTP pyrophosphatase (non-canonical NTP hydrolase)
MTTVWTPRTVGSIVELDEYQKQASRSVVYDDNKDLGYLADLLVGEAEELTERIRELSDGHFPIDRFRSSIASELGDILWYVSDMARKIEYPLSEVAEINLKKLLKRYPKRETNMKPNQYDVYLAGPFFTPSQVKIMDRVKELLTSYDITIADPREMGGGVILTKLSPENRAAAAQQVFDKNIKGIKDSFMILACIDDRDTGTAFELGVGYMIGLSKKYPLVTFSGQGFGANVMISKACDFHCSTIEELESFLEMSHSYIKEQDADGFLEKILRTTAEVTE